MSATAAANRTEAERWISIAEKLLAARDLVGSKEFAERAIDADPLLDGADQILAVADVLLAAQSNAVNNQLNWYSILDLDPHPTPDPAAVKRHYRRLALLLHPDRNKAPGADAAFRLVVDAWAVLSDQSKKSLFDAELQIAAVQPRSNGPTPPPASSDSPPPPFWTACPVCCHVYQYARVYEDRLLRCPDCHRAFRATAMQSPPPVVPGTDMYYCSWGFFPLGFPGGPNPPDLGSGWKPFHPMFPTTWPQPQPQPGQQSHGRDPVRESPTPPPPDVGGARKAEAMKNRKKRVARKRVGNSSQMSEGGTVPFSPAPQPWEEEAGQKRTNINITEEEVEGAKVDEIHIDLDGTDELLGNLQEPPVLKVEVIQEEIPKEV